MTNPLRALTIEAGTLIKNIKKIKYRRFLKIRSMCLFLKNLIFQNFYDEIKACSTLAHIKIYGLSNSMKKAVSIGFHAGVRMGNRLLFKMLSTIEFYLFRSSAHYESVKMSANQHIICAIYYDDANCSGCAAREYALKMQINTKQQALA